MTSHAEPDLRRDLVVIRVRSDAATITRLTHSLIDEPPCSGYSYEPFAVAAIASPSGRALHVIAARGNGGRLHRQMRIHLGAGRRGSVLDVTGLFSIYSVPTEDASPRDIADVTEREPAAMVVEFGGENLLLVPNEPFGAMDLDAASPRLREPARKTPDPVLTHRGELVHE